MNRADIRKIARRNHTTTQQVRLAMQEALDYADRNACQNEIAKKHLDQIYQGRPHTPESFILGTVEKIEKSMISSHGLKKYAAESYGTVLELNTLS